MSAIHMLHCGIITCYWMERCDLDSGCKSRGLRYVLHVARENNRQAVVKALASSASCIVTDLFPLPPWTHWVRRMAQSANCPVIEVDCHCVIPMTLFGKSVDRPFKFLRCDQKNAQTTRPANLAKCRGNS